MSVYWTFFAGCYGWGATSEYRFKIDDFVPKGPADPKFHVNFSPTNHSSCQITRLNDLSYGIKIWTDLSSVLSQWSRLTDGQTARRTDRFLIPRPCLHSMQRGKNSSRRMTTAATTKMFWLFSRACWILRFCALSYAGFSSKLFGAR